MDRKLQEMDREAQQRYLLEEALHGMFQTRDVVEKDYLFLPEWNLQIRPQIGQLTEQSAMIHFHLYAPQWGKELYECSVGMGRDAETAVGMATGSFLFSFMEGIDRMERQEEPRLVETRFGGREHRWKVYVSNVVGMGESPQLEHVGVYWDQLKDEIVKRLGNQEVCYVKIYGARTGEDITGECRIDDIKSDELSEMVAQIVSGWEPVQFASHKQFFFIRQEQDTVAPNPYSGISGRRLLREKVVKAAQMFHESKTQEAYDSLPDRLKEALGDATLAEECYGFLPEMCAQNAFPEISYSETVDILRAGDEKVTCYQSQLSDYWPIWNALFDAFSQGVFGEETNDVYREYISVSSIYNVIQQMQEKGSQLSDCKLTSLLFQVGRDFEIR